MDRAYQPAELDWSSTQPRRITLDDRVLPYRYEIHYEPSPIWSVVSLHETFERLPEIEDRVVFQVSQQHADGMAELLLHFAGHVRQLGLVVDQLGQRGGDRKWAQLTADLLLEFDRMASAVSPDIKRRRRGQVSINDTAAWVLVPMLQVLGKLTAEEDTVAALPPQVVEERVGASVGGILLRSSFRLSGRQLPSGLILDVFNTLNDAGPECRETLIDNLLQAYHSTPARYPALGDSADKAAEAINGLASGMEFLAEMAGQWQHFDHVALEVREHDNDTVAALEFEVHPDEVVSVTGLHFAAPRIELSGRGRVVIHRGKADERMRVLFESQDSGGIVLRFEGIVYLMADIFAFRLDDANLREIGYQSKLDDAGGKHRVVEVLMEAVEGEEKRRVIRVDTAKTPILEARADLPPRLVGRERTITFEYYNGKRVYEHISSKIQKPELWNLSN
jgi:hypothetical protein